MLSLLLVQQLDQVANTDLNFVLNQIIIRVQSEYDRFIDKYSMGLYYITIF